MPAGYFHHTFDINAVIAAPFFYLLGGSTSVTNANLFAIIADIAVDDVERRVSLPVSSGALPLNLISGPRFLDTCHQRDKSYSS
jgi:hypothetical protein